MTWFQTLHQSLVPSLVCSLHQNRGFRPIQISLVFSRAFFPFAFSQAHPLSKRMGVCCNGSYDQCQTILNIFAGLFPCTSTVLPQPRVSSQAYLYLQTIDYLSTRRSYHVLYFMAPKMLFRSVPSASTNHGES